jgi:hypothetical protein
MKITIVTDTGILVYMHTNLISHQKDENHDSHRNRDNSIHVWSLHQSRVVTT